MNGVPCRNEENQQEKTEKTERIFLRSRLPLHCAFVPHADHLIIGSNFCQARMGGPNPRPSNFLNREIREESRPFPPKQIGVRVGVRQISSLRLAPLGGARHRCIVSWIKSADQWKSGAGAPHSKAACRPRVFRAKRRGARKFRFGCGTGSFAQLEEFCLTPCHP